VLAEFLAGEREQFLSVKGVGKRTLAEIRLALAEHQLEHSAAQREQWHAVGAFKRSFEAALAEFMHGWLDEAPEAASNEFVLYGHQLRELDASVAYSRLTREEKIAAIVEYRAECQERLAFLHRNDKEA
jgi:hypothetical protein